MNNVRKFLIFLLGVGLISSVLALSARSVSALSVREVLGDSTIQEPLSIPPTTDGPGIILPDSPLFFLDQLKQGFRLLLAFTPEQKAKIHTAIAGERLAELQIMLARNNVSGIRTALQGVSDNLKAASGNLNNAKLAGRNINLLAKEINDSIKEKDDKLSVLEDKATGEIKAQVMAAKKSLRASKAKVEDNLPEDLLKNEIEDDLNREIEDHINNATDSAKGINRAIDILTRLVVNKAENKVQEKVLEAKKKTLEKAKEAVSKIDEAIKQFQETQNKISEIRSSESNNSESGNSEESKIKSSGSSNSDDGKSGSE